MTTTPPTMTGMVLDSIQQTTRTPWTTSLDSKKGSHKSELLDGFSPVTTSPDNPPVMTPTKMTPPVKSSLFNDTPNEENLPTKSPSTFPACPSPNTSSPSAASIAGAMARLKKLVQPPAHTKPSFNLALLPGIL